MYTVGYHTNKTQVERSHREDQKLFYNTHSFYSLEDFEQQLKIHLRRKNNIPMRPLGWLSPLEKLRNYIGEAA
ncbi:hypothetical protein AGMMS50284_7240 [Clostridia bacterium]|nr:hypothetical protein AGMMS50284_7240 [Clostridia bacterium]